MKKDILKWKIETTQQEGEAPYKQPLETVTDYIYSVKIEEGQAVVTIHGSGCLAVTGFTPQEYEANPHLWYQMIFEEDRAAVLDQAARLLSGKNVTPLEHRLIHKDGSTRWVRNTPVPRYNEQGQLIAYDGLISDITERKLIEAERERLLEAEREQRLLAETLGEVFLALTSQTNHDTVLNEILYQAQRLVPYDGAHMMLLENETLRIARWRGYENFDSEKLVASLEQSLANFPLDAEVVQTFRPLVVPDTRQNPHWVTMPGVTWIKSFICIPICLQDQVLGLLRLDGELPNKFSPRDAERLQPLANAAAVALENAQLYAQVQQDLAERKRTEETLKESEANLAASEARLMDEMQSVLIITHALVSKVDLNNLLEFIMVQAEHLMNANGSTVLLLCDDDQQLEVAAPRESWLRIEPGTRVPVKGSIAELALASHQVQFSNFSQDDDLIASFRPMLSPFICHSLLCAPLIIQSNSLGVLLIWSEHKGAFTTEDSYLITLFANQAALALHNARLHAENRKLIIEQERHRLARELHDSVTQSLYSIGLAAQTALKLLRQNLSSDIQPPLEHIHTLSQIALLEMRERLYDLQPTALNEGLVTALVEHCQMLSKQYALEIGFKANLDAPLSIDRQHTLYYLIKEALWNIVKHADATHITIVMTSEGDQIVIVIADDGVGFDPSAIDEGESQGLRNMKERTALLAGTFELHSTPGQGTRITVRIPLDH